MKDKIDKILDKETTKKEFLQKAGIGIFILLVAPSLIGWIFKEEKEELSNEEIFNLRNIIEVSK